MMRPIVYLLVPLRLVVQNATKCKRHQTSGEEGKPMSEPELLFERDGPLATVTFNRPEARNAMTWAMYDGLVEACETVDGAGERRVLFAGGAGGKAFVAAPNTSQSQPSPPPEDAREYERGRARVIGGREAVTKPTFAAIEGPATGA